MADGLSLGAVFYDILAYDKTKAGTESASAQLKKLGKDATDLGKKMSMAITLPILGAATAATLFAGNAAESQSKFEQVFGDMSDSAAEWAEDYGNAAGRATTDLKDMLSTTMSIVKAMGMTGDAGKEFSETIAQLSIDMGSFHNTTDEEAFIALRAAITGEYEPMKRYGVVINEAAVAQELLNMGIEGGTAAATNAQKAQARMNLIMAATTDAQGDAVRTADSFSNQMKALQADLKEVSEVIGAKILPIAESGIGIIRQMVAGFERLDDSTQTMIIVTAGFAAALGPAIWLAGTAITTIGQIRLVMEAYKVSTFAATVATRGFSVALLTTPAGMVALAVAGLVAGLAVLTYTLGQAKDEAFDLGDAMAYSSQEMREHAAALREEESVFTQMLRAASAWAKGSAAYGAEVAMAFGGVHESMRQAEADQWDYAAVMKDALSAAEAELRNANDAYSTHQQKVSSLTQEYDDLKAAIDRATEMPEEIDDQGRAIEHAEIALARAIERQKNLGADASSLDRREADLAVRDAKDRLEDAQKRLDDLKAENDEILGGQTLEEAQARLDGLQKQRDDENALAEQALKDRNEIQKVYDEIAAQNDEDLHQGYKDRWAALAKYFEENPVAGKIGLDMSWFGSKTSGAEVPAMASGGIVTEPTLALIGEAGPEAVVPLSQGGLGGGDTFQVTINISDKERIDVDSLVSELFSKIEELQRAKRVQRGVRA
jgi:hypothetical protein